MDNGLHITQGKKRIEKTYVYLGTTLHSHLDNLVHIRCSFTLKVYNKSSHKNSEQQNILECI